MKKTYFMVLALASMLCLGFSSCGDDDDDDSSSTSAVDSTMLKNAVGTYSKKSVFYVVKADGTMEKDTAGIVKSEASFSIANVTAQGASSLLITDSEETDDVTTCTDLASISKGFSFNVSTLKSEGTVWSGYCKSGVKYNGSFNSSAKTIVYYRQMSTSDYFATFVNQSSVYAAIAKMYPTIVIENTLTKQ